MVTCLSFWNWAIKWESTLLSSHNPRKVNLKINRLCIYSCICYADIANQPTFEDISDNSRNISWKQRSSGHCRILMKYWYWCPSWPQHNPDGDLHWVGQETRARRKHYSVTLQSSIWKNINSVYKACFKTFKSSFYCTFVETVWLVPRTCCCIWFQMIKFWKCCESWRGPPGCQAPTQFLQDWSSSSGNHQTLLWIQNFGHWSCLRWVLMGRLLWIWKSSHFRLFWYQHFPSPKQDCF